jgi:hypothetical protein
MTLPQHVPGLIHTFQHAGGIFAILVLIHFMADFLFQSYKVIDAKYKKFRELSLHSLIYASQFLPILYFLSLTWVEIIVSFLWLMCSHFAIDSMWLTNHWLKHVYRPPDLVATPRGIFGWTTSHKNSIRILIVDHIQHAFALWPIVIMSIY